MSAAVYCRVSTENQEQEGTSLQTQLEACLKYCHDKGYEVAYRFSETYSGLSLERPELERVRELVRNEQIEVVVCYSLDRLSRDPGHGVIITQELEKHGVKLETVTEDVDNSELGKLISYIRGYASKVEAEKIRERTMRGKRARALQGRIPGGSGANCYGYDYLKGQGRRVINESETFWVRKMYEWLVNEGISSNQILFRLRAQNAPTKNGNIWNRHSVQSILINPAYAGRTFVFHTKNHRKFAKPEAEWVEIPDVTPAIITLELFNAAQKQLLVNREKSPRNRKREYLLHGHLQCRQCGRSYYSGTAESLQNGKLYIQRNYRCKGKLKQYVPVDRCHNKGWSANKLEALVWAELEKYLSKPELIVSQLEAQRHDVDQLNVFESELVQVERQLTAVDREQHQLLQWALKGFPESQVETENKRLNKARETLMVQKTELETKIKTSREAVISLPKIETFVKQMKAGIEALDYEGKRQVLDMLDIKVLLDGESVEITGVIPVEQDVIVPTQS
jgi:site-specific DNA recombinase